MTQSLTQTSAAFSVRALSPYIGAEIVGLDLSQPLNGETCNALRAAWLDHLVLVFRG